MHAAHETEAAQRTLETHRTKAHAFLAHLLHLIFETRIQHHVLLRLESHAPALGSAESGVAGGHEEVLHLRLVRVFVNVQDPTVSVQPCQQRASTHTRNGTDEQTFRSHDLPTLHLDVKTITTDRAPTHRSSTATRQRARSW